MEQMEQTTIDDFKNEREWSDINAMRFKRLLKTTNVPETTSTISTSKTINMKNNVQNKSSPFKKRKTISTEIKIDQGKKTKMEKEDKIEKDLSHPKNQTKRVTIKKDTMHPVQQFTFQPIQHIQHIQKTIQKTIQPTQHIKKITHKTIFAFPQQQTSQTLQTSQTSQTPLQQVLYQLPKKQTLPQTPILLQQTSQQTPQQTPTQITPIPEKPCLFKTRPERNVWVGDDETFYKTIKISPKKWNAIELNALIELENTGISPKLIKTDIQINCVTMNMQLIRGKNMEEMLCEIQENFCLKNDSSPLGDQVQYQSLWKKNFNSFYETVKISPIPLLFNSALNSLLRSPNLQNVDRNNKDVALEKLKTNATDSTIILEKEELPSLLPPSVSNETCFFIDDVEFSAMERLWKRNLKDEKVALSLAIRLLLSYWMCESLLKLNQTKRNHGDFKLQNIMVSKEEGKAYLVDFEYSTNLDSIDKNLGFRGTPYFSCPDALSFKVKKGVVWDECLHRKNDAWGLLTCSHYLFSGKNTVYDDTLQEQEYFLKVFSCPYEYKINFEQSWMNRWFIQNLENLRKAKSPERIIDIVKEFSTRNVLYLKSLLSAFPSLRNTTDTKKNATLDLRSMSMEKDIKIDIEDTSDITTDGYSPIPPPTENNTFEDCNKNKSDDNNKEGDFLKEFSFSHLAP